MRYLSIDLGTKRTGVAVGDSETKFVSPVEVVAAPPPTAARPGETLIAAIMKLINDHCPDELVLGLPLNMDGSEGPAAADVRAFGALLQQRTALPVRYQDERLTSHAAEKKLDRTGRTHQQKKELRDALAAAEILEDFLHAT